MRLRVGESNRNGCGPLFDNYDGPLLTIVREETGRRVLIDNSYLRGKLGRQTDANGDGRRIRHGAGFNGAYASRAVVATSDGAAHEIRMEDFVPRWIRNSGKGQE